MQIQAKIWAYLQGGIKTDEKESFRDWLKSSAANKREYDRIRIIWTESEHTDMLRGENVEESWREINSKIKDKYRET